MRRLVLLITALILLPSVTWAQLNQGCTDGSTCYCDTPEITGDGLILLCEDFEDPAYHDDVDNAWYKSPAGNDGFRGGDNQWFLNYPGQDSGTWSSGEPASPTLGFQCGFGTCGPTEWRADDLWQGNIQSCIDVQVAGEVDDELPGLTLNSNHEGDQWFSYRLAGTGTAGGKKPCGILGTASLGKTVTEVGVTFLVAFSENILTADTGVNDGDFLAEPWKTQEWGSGVDTPLFMGNVGDGGAPFSPHYQLIGNGDLAACSANVAGKATVGTLICEDITGGLTNGFDIGSDFDRSTDWPLGEWACVQGHISGLGTSNGSMSIKFNGTTIHEHANVDYGTFFSLGSVNSFVWNAFYNGNQPGGTPVNETISRYMDRFVVREGAPVDCPAEFVAPSSTCTDGVDCYCDCVDDTDGIGNNITFEFNPYSNQACLNRGAKIDSASLFCEDFDAEALRDFGTSRDGDGAPSWGHWYSNNPPLAGQTNFRGFTSWWTQNYNIPNGPCTIPENTPVSPTEGAPCETGTGNSCSTAEWSSGDPYQMTSEANPCIDIFADTEFDDELAAQGTPDTPGTDDNRGHWEGNASLAFRVAGGLPNAMGVVSGINPSGFGGAGAKTFWPGTVTDIGFTQMVAYSDNVDASNIFTFPWKHLEFFENDIGASGPLEANFWVLGNTGSGTVPYSGFLWAENSNNLVSGATCTVPSSGCLVAEDSGTIVGTVQYVTSGFTQATDWEWGDWGCSRAEMIGMGTASTTMKIWHNDVLIHHSNFDGTLLNNQAYTGFALNAFANINQIDPPGAPGSTQTVRRAHDNIHITNGPSVTCEDIGMAPSLGPCVDGTDCYCDCIADGTSQSCLDRYGSDITKINVRMCEDFEAVTLYEDVNFGGGAPLYGPWYDNTGEIFANDRGKGSYWGNVYGTGGSGTWETGEPGSPSLGVTCTTGPCTGLKVYHPDDLWDANSLAPEVDIQRDGDFGHEVGDAEPELRLCSNDDSFCTLDADCAGGTCDVAITGVIDGRQSFAYRIHPGQVNEIKGDGDLSPGFSTDLGWAMLVGYNSRIEEPGFEEIDCTAWKGDELVGDGPFGGFECGLTVNWNSSDAPGGDPIAQGFPGAGCSINQSTDSCTINSQTVGSATCESAAINWDWGGGYSWDTHFKAGRWHCVRTWIENINTTSSRWRSWVDDNLVLDINVDGSGQQFSNNIQTYKWDAFANVNDPGGPGQSCADTTQPVRRYQDNVILTDGEPPTCAEMISVAISEPPPSGPDPVVASLQATPGRGGAPVAGVQLDATLTGGTGPNFRYTYDCNDTDADPSTDPESGPTIVASSSHSPASTICDTDYALPDFSGGYSASVLIEDCGTSGVCASVLDSDTSTVNVDVFNRPGASSFGGGVGEANPSNLLLHH